MQCKTSMLIENHNEIKTTTLNQEPYGVCKHSFNYVRVCITNCHNQSYKEKDMYRK